jgi:hypothetical protein
MNTIQEILLKYENINNLIISQLSEDHFKIQDISGIETVPAESILENYKLSLQLSKLQSNMVQKLISEIREKLR